MNVRFLIVLYSEAKGSHVKTLCEEHATFRISKCEFIEKSLRKVLDVLIPYYQ